jgi:glycosyltransferase involved in cell wall biosynthesis
MFKFNAREMSTVANYSNDLLSVVIPCLDEGESIPPLLEALNCALTATGRPYEIIVVDDGSKDATPRILEQASAEQPLLRACICRRNFGKSNALDIGFRMARGEIIITLDGDGQDDPAEVVGLLEALDDGADMVVGWKAKRQDPGHKIIASRIFNYFVRQVSGLRLHDMDSGLKAFRREIVEEIALYGELHRFLPVLAHWQGYRVVERPVCHHVRRHGRSKYGCQRLLRGAFDFLTVMFITKYLMRPMHFFGQVGLALGVPGTVICLYLATLKILGNDLGFRPLLNLGILLVIMGGVFFSTGLLGEMIVHLHQQGSRHVPPYMVRNFVGHAEGDDA